MLIGKKWLDADELLKWSIRIDYTARDDNGKPFRARSTFQCEARSVKEAYILADSAQWEEGMKPVKFGEIVQGWHTLRI